MSIFDDLFGNGQAGQQPGQPPAPPPQPGAPPSAMPSYGDFYSAANDGAFINGMLSNANHGIIGAILGGIAARRNLPITAPAAYDALTSQGLDTENRRLSLAQTLAFMSRAGVDPSAYLARLNGGSPAPQGGTPAQGGPAIPAGIQTEQTPAAAANVVSGGPAAPVPIGTNASGGGMNPPTGTRAPLFSIGTNTDPSAFLARVSPRGVPGATPNAPSAAPGGNPADALRQRYSQLALAMSGLPAYAPQALEYTKLAQTGALPNTVVDPSTGHMVDAVTGAPINMDASAYLAQRGAQAAGASKAAELPYVEAESGYDAAAHGAQQRQTDAARIYGEAATAAPLTMRAPDGSIVAVSRAQLPQLTANGGFSGYRPVTAEDEKALGAFGDQYAKDQASLPDVRKLQGTIAVMQDQSKEFQPGTFGDLRATGARFLAGLGVPNDKLAATLGNPASADAMVKDAFQLATQHLRDTLGAGREAGFVINNAIKSNPNIQTQAEAYRFMLNVMNQEAQRQSDYITEQQAYRAQHGTIEGFPESFDRTHPVGDYTSQAYADTYLPPSAPAGSKFIGRYQGRPVFQDPHGRQFVPGGQQ
jgi:hypothetical protein